MEISNYCTRVFCSDLQSITFNGRTDFFFRNLLVKSVPCRALLILFLFVGLLFYLRAYLTGSEA